MHHTAHWTARRSYVVLAFILIILALILAGCLNIDQETKGTVTPGTVGHAAGDVVDHDSGSITRGPIIDAVIGGAAGVIIGLQDGSTGEGDAARSSAT